MIEAQSKKGRRERGGRGKESTGHELTGEMMGEMESLDNLLSRSLIVERNKSYEEYKNGLKKRLDDFEVYVEGLKQETVVFKEYWEKCVTALRPGDFVK
jgi:hypothetical protein